MSNSCLITKLRGVVANPELEYFDALQFRADLSLLDGGGILLFNSSGNTLRFGGPGVKVIILENGEIRAAGAAPGSGVPEFVIPEDWQQSGSSAVLCVLDSSSPVEFLLIGLDKIEHLDLNYPNTTKIELRDPKLLSLCSNLQAFERSGTVEMPIFRPYEENSRCDISIYLQNFAEKTRVEQFRIYDKIGSGGIITGSQGYVGYSALARITRDMVVDYGDLVDFSALTELTALGLGLSGSTRGVEGDITSLGMLTKLTLINANNTKVSGTLESFAAAQYSNGRKTASRVHIFGPYLTYDDAGETKYVGSAGVYLSWTDGGSAPVVSVSLT